MPNLRNIIAKINASLQAGNFSSRKMQAGNWGSLAYVSTRMEDDKETKRPALFDLDGEGLAVDPNDTYPIQFYHRITSPITYPDLSININEGFGNPAHDNKEVAEMALICIGSTKKVKAFREEVCAAICADIPRELPTIDLIALKLEDLNIEILDTNTETEAVFNQEFSNIEFNLPAEIFMISVKYRITSYFSKNCFALCN